MTKLLMFEVDVKNVTEGREGGKDQLGFGVLMLVLQSLLTPHFKITPNTWFVDNLISIQ